jgi:hypothetical protein
MRAVPVRRVDRRPRVLRHAEGAQHARLHLRLVLPKPVGLNEDPHVLRSQRDDLLFEELGGLLVCPADARVGESEHPAVELRTEADERLGERLIKSQGKVGSQNLCRQDK